MRKEDKKKRTKIGFNSMIITMILALLAFLLISHFDLGNGQGVDTNPNSGGNEEGTKESDMNTDSSELNKENEENEETEITAALTVTVSGESIYLSDSKGESEITLSNLEEELKGLQQNQTVLLYDDGAINKTYTEVEQIIDDYVESQGIIKIEKDK